VRVASDLIVSSRGELTVHVVAGFVDLGVDVFVTDRFGGVSARPFDALNLGDHVGDDIDAVQENRRRVAQAVGVALGQLVIARQVHGATVLDVTTSRSDLVGDALCTKESGLALAILVADCVPLALVDPEQHLLTLVHAGWRGLASGVIANALAAYDQPKNVTAFIGPSISKESYQVGPDVAQHFLAYEKALQSDVKDRSRLDLRNVAIQQLELAGVHSDNIICSREVTDGGELFYSDRAARPCGRFGLVAKWSS
jgi:YfiH family protein